jgi:hypothetical protein
MIREEAITVLEGLLDNPLFSNQHKAAFNIAIHDIKAYHDWNINNLILINKDNYEPLEQEPRWIPVSERLPDADDEFLCWYEYYHWSQGKVLPEYGVGRYLRVTSSWSGEVASGRDVRVIAWMPLPKPYRGEK